MSLWFYCIQAFGSHHPTRITYQKYSVGDNVEKALTCLRAMQKALVQEKPTQLQTIPDTAEAKKPQGNIIKNNQVNK